MITIRRAVFQDMDAINGLLAQVLYVHHVIRPDLFRARGAKYTEEQLAAILADDSRPVFVAVDETGRVLGHAFCMLQENVGPSLTGYRTLYIDDLCVAEESRGQHVGSSIYKYVLDYAGKRGCHNVTLHVWEGNDSARKFYEDMGMKPYMTGMEAILTGNFYGRKETADVRAVNHLYKGIETPAELYEALTQVWCAATCAPRMREAWSPRNRTKGQCSITAFLAQDIFGGEVYGIRTKGGDVHCFNVVGGVCFDLTSEQFGAEAGQLVYTKDWPQSREEHFQKEEKRQRYEYLKDGLAMLS